ncbi:MAG: UPF0149 family protein [Mesorhizobium sp.]|uniref:UPF0149 family protein n=1 Tax=Mesorhizobium sp. TaxID=1871066 RepID=UPI0012267D3E|nr:UPF0149 family protein [Mesorhizobium sp.]TIQ26188.1 MAG: UPF0149 family protein [Mesorhizobium sp.]
MSALDAMALSDEALEAWMAAKTNRPLVRTMSALDGFVTAAVTGPRYPDPQDWMCPLMGLPRDVLTKGSATDHAVFASVARIHNRINETLFDRPQDYAPRFATKPSGGIDPRPWCQGFYAAMSLNIKSWKRLLDLDNPNHGLLLPILIHCVDKKGRPVLGKPRPGPETAHFIEYEAYKDISLVIPALRELHYVTHNPQ